MIEHRALPAGFVVAIFALFTFLPLVHIIAPVTRVTGFTELLLAQHAFVACSTLDSIVFTAQGEAGLSGVVEFRVGPGRSGMTAFAFLTELAFMSLTVIILTMAGNTLLWRVLVIFRLVTGSALYVAMFAG